MLVAMRVTVPTSTALMGSSLKVASASSIHVESALVVEPPERAIGPENSPRPAWLLTEYPTGP